MRLIRDGEKGGRGYGDGGRWRAYNYRYTVTTRTNQNLFEEKGEPKRYRTEVLFPLTNPFLIGRMFFREPS